MDKIRMAIIGAGLWGETHANILRTHPLVELTAVCDVNVEKAHRLARAIGLSEERVFSDHREMIRQGGFEAASVVTPDFLHREFTVDLANAGVHILVEKPLATTQADLRAIVEAVERNNVRIMVDFHNRFSPPFAVAKDSIDRGEIGEPWNAYFRLNDIKSVATDMLVWAAKSSILWFLGSHSIDTLRWFFSSEVRRVYSVSRRGVLDRLGVETEDLYQTILEFDNGGIATMENSWILPDTHPCVNDIKFNIVGTKGMLNLDLSNSQLIERYTEEKSDNPDTFVKHFVHGYPAGFAYQSIRHFVDRLADGKEFFVSLDDAVQTSLVVLSIIESARRREPVEVMKL